MITVALAKGALLTDSIRLFQSVGLDFSAFLDKGNRQLQITDPTNTAKALLPTMSPFMWNTARLNWE
jgi:ATP phosphoribosyltransferase